MLSGVDALRKSTLRRVDSIDNLEKYYYEDV